MLPGSIDPRRPDKQQRYKPPPANNNAAPGEDLTPDYMNILDSQRKSMQTPRSDRFKIVKIESTEPFKRGRWKCMDFLDQSYAKIFQQNYSNRSAENTPPSPKTNNDTNITNSCGSWGSTSSYVDLQNSMLQIFYRQNSTENQNQCTCLNNDQNVQSLCCDEKNIYVNHVLRPGMVSSSLVGIDFPLELNFVPTNTEQLPNVFKENTASSISNNNQPINLVCSSKSQTSNIDIQKFQENMSSDHITIQPAQIANYAQIPQDLMQKNLNVPQQELINPNSGIVTQYVQNLINNDPSINYPNNQQTLVKEEHLIDNQNGTNIGQIITQNLLPANQANATELNKAQYNNNNPIYVNIQNLTCPQQTVNIPDSNNTKTLISEQQITSASIESTSPNQVSTGRLQESQVKNALENVCDSTTQIENMSQNTQTVINGNYVPNTNYVPNPVPNNNYVPNSAPNNNEAVPNEYFQNLVQTLDPNNPNLVQKFVVQSIVPNNNLVQAPVPNNNLVQSSPVPNNNLVQNCVPNNGNNVHYIVYNNGNTNSPQNTSNCNVQNYELNNANTVQNFVPTNANFVQTVVQNAPSANPTLMLNDSNLQSTAGNSNPNLNQNNSNSSPSIVQTSDKISQNVVYQGQISLIEGPSCNYKQGHQQDITPLFQSSQNSIQSTLQSTTCIHAFLNEERTLVQNNNTVDLQGKNVPNLPVDTKIEALMDLVKKHLKCTVMEEVNVLKHKILELKERIAQLEYENELLKNQYKRNSL